MPFYASECCMLELNNNVWRLAPALRNRKVKNLQSSNELSPGDYFHTYILHKLSRTQHQQNILRKLQTENITANIARAWKWSNGPNILRIEREYLREEDIGIGGGNRSCGVFRDPAQNIIITSSFSNFPKFESPTQITFLTNVCRDTPTRPGRPGSSEKIFGTQNILTQNAD